MKKNIFLTFCFAFVPGAGQMYQGYMKRGLSLCALFCAGIALTTIIPYFGVLLPLVWMYAFFDTFNIRNLASMNAAMPMDDYVVHTGLLESGKSFIQRRPQLVGIGLVVLGGWMLLNNLVLPYVENFIRQFNLNWNLYWALRNDIPMLLISLLIIFVGVKLAFGGRRRLPPPEDFTEFKGEEQ